MRPLLFVLFAFSVASASGQPGRPSGANCDLASPPKNSGEEFSHGLTLKVYPRARNIAADYNGCQITWMPEGKGWLVLAITAFERGDPVRIWSPDATSDPARYSCTYKNGKVITGDAPKCVAPMALVKKSLAPGCVAKLVKSSSGEFPPGCKYE